MKEHHRREQRGASHEEFQSNIKIKEMTLMTGIGGMDRFQLQQISSH